MRIYLLEMEVIDLTDTEFKDSLKNNQKAIVKYYADWCGSCRLFNPKYKRLSRDERFKNIAFLNINAENNPEARAMAEVSNLPFFAIFENGKLKNSIASTKEDAVVNLLNELD